MGCIRAENSLGRNVLYSNELCMYPDDAPKPDGVSRLWATWAADAWQFACGSQWTSRRQALPVARYCVKCSPGGHGSRRVNPVRLFSSARKPWVTSVATPGASRVVVWTVLLGLCEFVCIAASADSPASKNQSPSVVGALPSFRDITDEAGLAYEITCGNPITESLVDVNGQGACFLDYDGDGLLDVYLANGSSLSLEPDDNPPHDYLLRNQGDGTFSDVTKIAGLGDKNWSSGCAVGDYDNDSDPDLYLTNYGPNKLYRNRAGSFSEVSQAAGVSGPEWMPPKWSMGAAFADIDNDGDLDLYVANFTAFVPEIFVPPPTAASPCQLKGVPIICAPDFFHGQQDLLYSNNGDGTFTDVSRAAGIQQDMPSHGFAVVFSDYDDDLDQDIYVANDVGPNFSYENKGDGTFSDVSWASGANVNEHGEPEGSMGLTIGDYNNDTHPDIFVTNFVEQSNTIYENTGNKRFIDQTAARGLFPIGLNESGWGTKFIDFDNDGWLDIFIANGHTDERLESHFPTDTYAQPNYMLRSVEAKRFVDVSEAVGLRELPNKVSRGSAFADFDNDGDVDILVINKNDKPTFLRNDGGNRLNWIVIRALGIGSNRDGIGTKVLIESGGVRRGFEVRASDSYLSSNDIRIHVGLGAATSADIEVHWPSGHQDRYQTVVANRFYLAVEGQSLNVDPLATPIQQP